MLRTLLSLVACISIGGASALAWIGHGRATEHRILVGLDTYTACVTTGWHDSGHPGWSALDLRPNNCSDTSSVGVYWRSYHSSGAQIMVNTPVPHDGQCTGMDVKPYAFDYGYLGDQTYTHISVSSWGSWVSEVNNGFTIRYVGTVLTDENATCKANGFWSAIHLHQGAYTTSPPVYRNWSLPGAGGSISPVFDTANYEHLYSW